jgi:heme-degrading monooxygenase HmoA
MKEDDMWARVSTYEGPPDGIDDAVDYANREVVPQLRQADGFRGLYALADRTSGRSMSITLWDSEEALNTSEEAANRMRQDSTDAARGQIANVERFEVTMRELI